MKVDVTIDPDEVLDQLDTEYVISYYGKEIFLDEIGAEFAAKYYDLIFPD